MANSPARASVDVGAVIADTYIIEALIGQGGMGSVFLASHNRLPGKRVAIKMLHVELDSEEVITRFRREATIASQLDHPNIVRVDDFNVHADGTPYLVLEYLEGESLAQRLKAGPMPLEQVMSVMRMVGSAIAAAHQRGYIHRDLKPQNIFLIQSELDGHQVEVAKVLDFGISKMLNSTTVKTQESTLLGTPQYMAPEQATGQHASVDERTDIFALGAIVYEMLTGAPAFSGENIPAVVFRVVYDQPPPLAEVAPATPREVIAAVERAMQKAPGDRFPTVHAFIEALTGRPLAQRSSMISLPPNERTGTPTTGTRAGQAAFANTIDSGSHAKSIAPRAPTPQPIPRTPTPIPRTPTPIPRTPTPIPRTPTPLPMPVSAHAETVASQHGDEPSPHPPTKPRRPFVVVGLALAFVVAAGAAIYFAVRGGADEPVRAVADAAVAAPVIDAASEPVTAIDAAVAVVEDAAVPPDAAVVARAVDAGTKSTRGGRQVTVNRKEGDPLAWEQLDKAEAAFKAGNVDLAKIHCNSVDNNGAATPVQRSLALVLRGTIHCKAQNLGLAQADLRAIPIASFKATLLARCKAFKQPLQ